MKYPKIKFSNLLFFLIAVCSLPASAQETIRIKFNPSEEKFLIAYDKASVKTSSKSIVHTGIIAVDNTLTKYQVTGMKRVFRPAGKFENRHIKYGLHLWYELKLDRSKNAEYNQCMSELKELPEISLVETTLKKELYGAEDKVTPLLNWNPDDPRYNEQWNYWNTGQSGGTPGADIYLQGAWKIQKGSNRVVVAVLDEGVDYTHEDLAGAMWVNEVEANGNAGVDDDNNGYIDDINGYGFGDNSGNYTIGEHGTHVAGTIGAINNNGIGVSGIAGGSGSGDGVRLMSCALYSATKNDGFDEGFIYAADNGAVIAQCSWGYESPNSYQQSILDAIDYFIACAGKDVNGIQNGPLLGGIVIFGAGNKNSNLEFYPGCYEPVIAVAATTHNDTKTWYSNFGTWIDVVAPGGETRTTNQGILSTLSNNSYGFYQGTSMACPHVSGMAALLVSEFGGPGFTNDSLRGLIVNTTDNIDDLNPDYQHFLGSGRINVYTALSSFDSIPPSPISNLIVSEITQLSAKLNWISSGNDSTWGRPYAYDIRYSTDSITEANFETSNRFLPTIRPKESGTPETCIITGLNPETKYYFGIKSSDYYKNTSEISNVVSAFTLKAPIVVVNPTSILEKLDSGLTVTSSFYLKNMGNENLSYSINSSGSIIIYKAGTMINPSLEMPENSKGNPIMTGAGIDGANGFGYRWIDSDEPNGPVFSWYDISTTGIGLEIQSNDFAEIKLPFPFRFYDSVYTKAYISANGFISFSSAGASSYTNKQIPYSSLPNALIAGFWDDLYTSKGSVFYQTIGNKFIVQYHKIKNVDGTGSNTFQIVLYKDGSIKYNYFQMFGKLNGSTIGIENPIGKQGLQVAYNFSYVHNNLSVVFIPTPKINFIKAINPMAGNVSVNDSMEIQLELSGDSLISGNYIDKVIISTNDELHPEIEFPVFLHVNGSSELHVSLDTLNYGTVFVTDTVDLSFRILVIGTDTLKVSNIISSNPAFIVCPYSKEPLYRNGVIDVTVSMAPAQEVQYIDTLTIISNAVNNLVTIILKGYGKLPPIISITPGSLAADLHINETEKQTLTIDNTTGGSELVVSIFNRRVTQVSPTILNTNNLEVLNPEDSGMVYTPSEQPIKGLNIKNTETNHRLFSIVYGTGQIDELDPTSGEIIKTIHPSENKKSFYFLTFDGTFLYTIKFDDSFQFCYLYKINANTGTECGSIKIDDLVSGIEFDGEYILAPLMDKNLLIKIDFESNQIVDTLFTKLSSSGIAIANSRGTVFANKYPNIIYEYDLETDEVVNYFVAGFYVGDMAYSNSLQQLFVADYNAGLIRVFNPDTGREIYSFAGGAGGLAADVGNFVNWLSTSVNYDTIPSGIKRDVDITFDANDVNGGDHYANIVINSNDPVIPKILIPAHLHVTGSPEIAVSPGSLNFGKVTSGYSDSIKVTINNPGTDMLIIDTIYSSDTHFIPEIQTTAVGPKKSVAFQVQYFANEFNTNTGSIFLNTNVPSNPTIEVALTGQSVIPPAIAVTPESIAAVMRVNETETHTITLNNTSGGNNLNYKLSAKANNTSVTPKTPSATDTLISFDVYPYKASYAGSMNMGSSSRGGYLYCGNSLDGYVYFDKPVNVNRFQMNNFPGENFTTGTKGYIDVNAYDINANLVWSTTVDLTGSTDWNHWIDVFVETDSVSYLEFKAPAGNPWYNNIWPSVDNIYLGNYLPWLKTETHSGSIPAGSSQNMAFTFKAEGLKCGTYDAQIIVLSNDSVNSKITVAIRLEVINTPPAYISTAERLYMKIDDVNLKVNLDTLFADADLDTLSYTVTPANNSVVSAIVNGNLVEFTAHSVGSTNCELVANDGKGGIVTKTLPFIVDFGQSVHDVLVKSANVFPNPITDKVSFAFELQESGNLQIKFFTVDGRAVGSIYNKMVNAGKQKIEVNTTQFEKGVYIYNIVINGKVVYIGTVAK